VIHTHRQRLHMHTQPTNRTRILISLVYVVIGMSIRLYRIRLRLSRSAAWLTMRGTAQSHKRNIAAIPCAPHLWCQCNPVHPSERTRRTHSAQQLVADVADASQGCTHAPHTALTWPPERHACRIECTSQLRPCRHLLPLALKKSTHRSGTGTVDLHTAAAHTETRAWMSGAR